jgi:hypothetical protein
MRYRRLDINNDPIFGQGKQDYLTSTEAIGQAILTRLRLFLGEWWENTALGLPVWESMLGVTGTKKEVIDRIIQENISDAPGVTGIAYLDTFFDSTTGDYIFYCQVNTNEGLIVVTNYQGSI